ncbi:unannotated protein [freshwater metagenome]|uniref:Unannotated protein n=1 Tax=freshwater metagenome TaxID=449393 RepID=A0A6J6FC98_9ZZZZ
MHDLFENRNKIANRSDLRTHEDDVRVLEHGFHAIGVGHEVRGDVALVEAHAFNKIHFHTEGVGLFNGDDTVLANLVDSFGDHRTDFRIGGRDTSNLSDLALVVDLDGNGVNAFDSSGNRGFDALLERHRVSACSNVAQTSADHRPCEHSGGGGAVTGNAVGLLGNLFDQLGADALVGVFEFDFLGDRHTVIGDGGSAPLLVEHHIATLRAEGDAHCVGELVHATFKTTSCGLVEFDDLGHR